MRHFLLFIFSFIALTLSGQIRHIDVPQVVNVHPGLLKNDSTIKVIYTDRKNTGKHPAYYLNGQFVNESILKTLNPQSIKNISVDNKETEIESTKYYDRIFLTTKEGFKQNLISLTDLKLKYTTFKKKPVLFMIDDEIITDDYNQFLVDENYILKITIEQIEPAKEKLSFILIRISTRSELNVANTKNIRIR